MSKLIKMTDEAISECFAEFIELLRTKKISDGKIKFEKTLGEVKRKATVFFTEKAWIKMNELIRSWDKEIAWHGVAKRGDDPEKDEYIISDILVYPQEVTGVTVETDQKQYEAWLAALPDDVFNNLRFQGHSHVNMGTSPSGTDLTLYEQLLSQLDEDMFYIFMIWNKRGEKTVKIYDMAKNLYFETGDCSIEVMDGNVGLDAFLKEAKTLVKNQVTYAGTSYAGAYGSSYKGGYDSYGYGAYGGSYSGNTGYFNDSLLPVKPAATAKTQTKSTAAQGGGKSAAAAKGKGGFRDDAAKPRRGNPKLEMAFDEDDDEDIYYDYR